jgi:exodeoxyribonuclease VII large subunit
VKSADLNNRWNTVTNTAIPLSGSLRKRELYKMNKPDQKRFFNLSDITTRIQQILQPHISKSFWVKAEISSGRERGGSFYCDLVETNENGKIIAQIRCTIWSRDLVNIRKQFKECDLDLRLDDGTAVGFQCFLQYSPQYGLSLKVSGADPAFALGELELRKKEILDRLSKEGLLEPNKNLFVPMLPLKIGLITSKGSAAYNDIVKTFTESGFGFEIYLADSNVQGLKTEETILNGLDALETLNIDLIIIARGGGSKTDLFYLDNEAIARRIAAYKHPVWTGIGHEIDIGILDQVANQYFKTPTAVAEEIVARFVEMKRHLDEARNRFKSTWSYRFESDRNWLDEAKTGIVQGTRKLLDTTKSYLRGYAIQLSSKVQERISNEKSDLSVSRKIIATAPINMIKSSIERLGDRTTRFIKNCQRMIVLRQKDLLRIQSRFQQKRFIQRIEQENLCLCDWRVQFLQKFNYWLNFQKQRIDLIKDRFKPEAVDLIVKNEKMKLMNKSATLRAADPDTSLKRGFSLVYTEDGDLVKSISQISIADSMRTHVSDGQIISTVNKTEGKNDD